MQWTRGSPPRQGVGAGMCPRAGGSTMLRTSRGVLLAGSFAAASLTGCYVIPVAPDGTPVYPAVASPPAYVVPSAPARAYVLSNAAVPNVFQARLYPSNDMATQTGVLSGTVTNMMTGKGRFELDYRGELLVGE